MILLITHDDGLADNLSEKFLRWGMRLARRHGVEEAAALFSRASIEIVLLDVRSGGKGIVERLCAIRRNLTAPPVLLLNRADNIQVSMAGMKAGAVDELTEPFCTETLKQKVVEAGQLCALSGRKQKRRKRSVFEIFSAAMSAAAMAQGGEFEAAVELYNSDSGRNDDKRDKNNGTVRQD